MVREVSPDLHLITPELHQVSPEFFFSTKWENAKCSSIFLSSKSFARIGNFARRLFSPTNCKKTYFGVQTEKKGFWRSQVYIYIYLQSIPWAVGFLHTSAVPTVLYSYMICWFWQDSESQNLVTWSNYESLCLFFIYRHVLINVHLHVHHVFKHYICHETFFYTETTGSLGP